MAEQRAAGSARCWQVGAAGLLFAGFVAYVFLGHSPSEASSAPFAPPVAALQADGKVRVAVALERAGSQDLTGDLRVDLVDRKDRVVTSGEQAIRQSEPVASYRFNLDAAKSEGLSVRVSFGGKTHEVALSRVLLAKAHETSLSSGQEFFAGSQAALRCRVQGIRSIAESLPLPGASVIVRLRDNAGKSRDLAETRTAANGLADVRMQVPEMPPGNYTLEVTTRSHLGEEKLERAIRVKADAKILLVSDRPIYQPGQMIHMRALVLRAFDMKPVENKDLLFEVEDGKGNKVFKRTFKTSEYGIASVDFQLADEVNMGDYHLRAIVGDHRADKTVTVKRYVLPKFKTAVTADKTFYLPKEKINASLQTDYFFGKPVSKGKIEVTASTFDIQFRKFQTWEGQTDANGHAKFEIQLPDYFVGQPLQKGNALVKLDVKVTDTADHSETVRRTYTVSDQPIRVSLIPEGGKLVPGMENRVFAAAIYPDGSPAVAEVNLWLGREAKGKPLAALATNAAGLAEFKITPKANQFRQGNFGPRDIEMLGGKQQGWGPSHVLDVRAEAKDDKGNRAFAVAELNSQPLGENVLLRLDKAIYKGGDSMNVDIRTSAGLPTVYLDIVRGGQIMLSRWFDIKDGQAAEQIDLPPSIFGSLEIHAYQMLASGEIIRDSRVAYVQPSNDLKIEIEPDKSVYLPGESGRIRFLVTDQKGKPAPAALGVIVVDEAVYALQEMQPGLEKVYFTLQEELLKPQVEIKFQPQAGLGDLVRRPMLAAPQQQIAEVLLTAVKLPPPPRWEVHPAQERRQRVDGQLLHIGQVLWNQAWNQPDTVMTYDKKANGLTFKPALLNQLVKQGQLPAQTIEAPLGGKLTMEDVTRLEPMFTPDQLGRAITLNRLQQLTWAVINYSNGHRNNYFKDGKWSFPKNFLVEATRGPGFQGNLLKDTWGEPIRLVHRDKKLEHRLGHTQFDYAELVSAGPDRKFGTKDDLRLTDWNQLNQLGWIGQSWWMEQEGETHGRQHARQQPHRFRRELLRNRAVMLADGMPMGGFGGGGPGGGLPMARAAAPGRALGAPKDLERADKSKSEPAQDAKGEAGGAPPKIREYFPETMLWMPALITDNKGIADLAVNFADSITTWRLTASASSRGGALGGTQIPLKVFQDFFVDIDLPVSLTQSDEVSFPVAVYNYLKTKQTLKLELQKEPWFELLDGKSVRSLDLAPNEVTSVKFRIRANKIGFQPLTVMAYGSKKSDAVKRVVDVVPNGQKIEKVASDRLSGKAKQTITIPETALPDASKLIVRIYPGVMAQVLEGVDGMIRLPGG
jgi:5-hydroxyisourate hydrolase-like protein (transthyretin family)